MLNKSVLNRIVIIIMIFFILICNLNYDNVVYSATQTSNVTNNREPRVSFKKNDKNYFYIILHDNAGIKTGQSYFMYNGKKIQVQLIQNSGGVYTKDGKRIKDLGNANYSGKKYDYGIKLANSEMTTSYKDIFVFAYDYGGSCFLKETFKIKKLAKADSNGYYYQTDCAPRVTVHLIDGKPKVDAIDWSGIKSIKIESEATREVVYSFEAKNMSVNKSSSSESKAKKSGYSLKDGVYYPIKVKEELDMKKMEKAKAGDDRYRIRVIAEDMSGIKNEKTMTTHITYQSTDNSNKNTNTNIYYYTKYRSQNITCL